MSSPTAMRGLAARWRERAKKQWDDGDNGQSIQSEACADELEKLADYWDAEIRAAREKDKTLSSLGPLHATGIAQAQAFILKDIVGEKP